MQVKEIPVNGGRTWPWFDVNANLASMTEEALRHHVQGLLPHAVKMADGEDGGVYTRCDHAAYLIDLLQDELRGRGLTPVPINWSKGVIEEACHG